MIMKIHQND